MTLLVNRALWGNIYQLSQKKYNMGHMYTYNQIPSEAQIRKYIRRILFGKNIFCPECKSRRVTTQSGRYRCKDCRIRFTLTSHSWLSNLKLPLQSWWTVLWSWSCAVPVKHSRDIHKKFEFEHTSEIEGVFGNYRTFARRMYHHHWSINLEKYVREFCFRFSSPELFKNPLFYLTKSLKLGTTC